MTSVDSRSVSVVVPVYNSAGTLEELVRRISAALGTREHEIVLVNDGSADGSADAIRRLAAVDPRVRGVFLMRNFGQHNALLAGIREARLAVTVTLDDDLQNPPEEIPALLASLAEGNDVVYGVPSKPRQDLWRVAASKLIRVAMRGALGERRASMVSPFRAFRTDVRRAFANYSSASVSIDVLLSWGAARFAAVPVRHDARQQGRSNYSLRRLVSHAIDMITGYSSWPLRFASIIGFLFTFFGIGVLVYVLGRYLVEGGSVPGFPFLASTIAIFAGAQLFALGIIGEYLAKVHFRMMNRPPYVIAPEDRDDG